MRSEAYTHTRSRQYGWPHSRLVQCPHPGSKGPSKKRHYVHYQLTPVDSGLRDSHVGMIPTPTSVCGTKGPARSSLHNRIHTISQCASQLTQLQSNLPATDPPAPGAGPCLGNSATLLRQRLDPALLEAGPSNYMSSMRGRPAFPLQLPPHTCTNHWRNNAASRRATTPCVQTLGCTTRAALYGRRAYTANANGFKCMVAGAQGQQVQWPSGALPPTVSRLPRWQQD